LTGNETTSGESSSDTTESVTRAATRRRASRAAGPAAGAVPEPAAQVVADSPSVVRVRPVKPVGPPPRRQPHRVLVAGLALGVTAVLVAAMAGVVALLFTQQRHAEAADARDQKFVDTASQTVVNMFSYTQDTIDDSVNRFVNGISGPLRDMMSQGNNVENLKAIFRDTNASSEAVINGSALEKVDDTADNASVLVSVRVTVTNLDGVNSPSKPYRLRVIVHEDDNGRMTGYDLKYPDGGN
jgi:Mce-associated membrane protein